MDRQQFHTFTVKGTFGVGALTACLGSSFQEAQRRLWCYLE